MTKQNQHSLIFTCTDGHFGCISREARIHKVVCAGETPYQVSFLTSYNYIPTLPRYIPMDVPTLHSFHLNQHVRSLRTHEFAKHKGKKEKKRTKDKRATT